MKERRERKEGNEQGKERKIKVEHDREGLDACFGNIFLSLSLLSSLSPSPLSSLFLFPIQLLEHQHHQYIIS